MFKPTATIKKLLLEWSNTVRIWEDGIVISKTKRVKTSGTFVDCHVTHYIPCEISIYARQASITPDSWQTTSVDVRFVTLNGKQLVHGCKSIDVYLLNSSEHSKEKGIYINTVTVTSPEGGESDVSWIPNMLQGRAHIYPDPTDRYSRHDCKDTPHLMTAKAYVAEQTNVITHTPKS